VAVFERANEAACLIMKSLSVKHKLLTPVKCCGYSLVRILSANHKRALHTWFQN